MGKKVIWFLNILFLYRQQNINPFKGQFALEKHG